MAGIETLIAATSPHGSAGSLAYSQMDFLPAIQVAALGGAPAIVFVMCAFASAVALLIAKRALRCCDLACRGRCNSARLGLRASRVKIHAETAKAQSCTSPRSPATISASKPPIGVRLGNPMSSRWSAPSARARASSCCRRRSSILGEGQAEHALAPLSAIAREHDVTIVVGAVATRRRPLASTAPISSPAKACALTTSVT